MYTYTDWHIIMAQSPWFYFPLLISFLLPSHSLFTYLETLLCVIGSRPPWSQVTRKLTSPFSTPQYSLPIPHSQYPRLIVRLTTTTSWSRLLMVRNTPLMMSSSLAFAVPSLRLSLSWWPSALGFQVAREVRWHHLSLVAWLVLRRPPLILCVGFFLFWPGTVHCSPYPNL